MDYTGADHGSFSPIAKNIGNLLSTPMSQVSTALDSPSPFSRPYSAPSDEEHSDGDSQEPRGKHVFLSLGEPAWPQDQTLPETTTVPHVLSPDGRALDRNGGAAMFDFAKDESPSHSTKAEAIDAMRALRAAKVAHSACEAEAVARSEDTDAFSTDALEFEADDKAWRACSIDVVGVLRGKVRITPATRSSTASTVKRAKILHRLCVRDRSFKDGCVFYMGPDGCVRPHFAEPSTSQSLSRRERAERQLMAVRRRQLFDSFCRRSPGVAPLPCIDPLGSVHWPDTGPVVDIQGRHAVWDLSGEEVDMYAAV